MSELCVKLRAVLDVSVEHATRLGILEYLSQSHQKGSPVLMSMPHEDQESAAKTVDVFGKFLYHNWECSSKEIDGLSEVDVKKRFVTALKKKRGVKTIRIS